MTKPTLLKTLVKVLISFGIIAVLVVNLNSNQLIQTFKMISFWQLGLAVLFNLFCQFLCSVRWLQLADSMDLGKGIAQFYEFYLLGMFFSLFLPSAIGGDLGKAVLLAKEKSAKWSLAFLTIVADRFCGLSGLMLFVLVGYYLLRPGHWSLFTMGLLVILSILVFLFTFYFSRIEHYPWGYWLIQRFILKPSLEEDEPPQYIWPTPKATAISIGISVLYHGFLVLLQVILLQILGVTVPFLLVALVYGLSSILAMIPVSINGIGFREGAITFLLVYWAHVPKNIAITFSLVWLSIIVLSSLSGGVLMLRRQVVIPARKKI